MRKILVIDDEEWLREMVRMALNERGFEVLEAENGATGVEVARRTLPDLILCDVNMEKVDGYLTLAALRNESATASIPFILMTGMADQAGMRHGMELGADDYLAKPFTLDGLFAAVEARLKKADAMRLEAERKLSSLRDNISLMLPHELRTPLNGILAYGELLASEAATLGPAEISEMGQVIHASGRRLERLVENFLIAAQIEIIAADAQKLRALREKRAADPARIVQERARLQAQAARREQDLVLDVLNTPCAISEEYLGKIIDEVVQNAFKFSEPGTRVHVQLTAPLDGLRLDVTDHGRGFSSEQIKNVGAYMQFDRKSHEQQGLGLGLTIARRLAELHAGSLAISSSPGERTTVEVRLPLAH
jgi:two-component system, sensor histidine kinase and response regulator